MRVNLVPESTRHLEMTRARQMRVDTRDLAEAHFSHAFLIVFVSEDEKLFIYERHRKFATVMLECLRL